MSEQNEQLNLSLPYEDFTGKMGSQAYAKATYKRGNDVMIFQIPFKDILIWEGYNARTVFENIEDLADSIHQHKQKTPFQLVLVKEGDRAYLKKGGRRHRAYQLLIEQGLFNPNDTVPFELTSTKETMEEMILDLHVSNQYPEPLKPIDLATVAWRLKHLCGAEKSNEEVSELLGAKKVSRQTVDNLLLIYNASDDIKNQIRVGDMNMTSAVSFIRSQKKLKKEADKKEEEAGQSSMYVQPDPKDSLRDEVAELEAAELQAEIYREREANRSRIEAERLERIANYLEVKEDVLLQHIGKRLAADATYNWVEDFVDEDTAEVFPVNRTNTVLKQGELLDENTIKDLVGSNVEKVYVFKEIIPTASVFTEPVADPESPKFDVSRPEIEKIQKCIQGADKVEAIVTKLDAPDDVKKDIAFQIYWLQRNLSDVRDWVHSNKKQNKKDR